MPITVRRANSQDAKFIADFNVAMAAETESLALDPATVLAGVAAGLADPAKAAYFVAECAGRLVGCCMITHEWSDWRNGDMWWLQSVYVHPDFRRQGAFAAMYRHVRDAAQSAGAVTIRLYVERHNERAKKTYESLGMRVTEYEVMEAAISDPDRDPGYTPR
jgi:ribosomal protein S18 acetylase RimI-like enzyme